MNKTTGDTVFIEFCILMELTFQKFYYQGVGL